MPSYAIIGSTGNIGQALIKVLLQTGAPDLSIHAYCRSKQKLHKLLPQVVGDGRVKVYEGNITNKELLAECIDGTRAIFLVVAPAGNQPGNTIMADTVKDVVAALEQLSSQSKKLPKLVMISSGSTEHRMMPGAPKILLNILYTALGNIYDDLKVAEAYLRSKDSLVATTFIKPGALCNDSQKGHALSLDVVKSPLSFLDLAAGMIEVADEAGERYDMKSVAVNPTAKDVAFPWTAPGNILRGLVAHFFPWAYRYVG